MTGSVSRYLHSLTSGAGPFNREARAELFGEITAECIDCGVTYSSDLHLPKFFTTDNEMSSW